MANHHFYTQGKNTESRVEIALSSIKAQVETLQTINGRCAIKPRRAGGFYVGVLHEK